MIFGFEHLILSVFGEQPFGPAPGQSRGTQPDQDMEDLYTVRVGLDTGDSQSQMQAFTGEFKNLGQGVSQGTAAMQAGFRRLNRYLGLLGVNISGMGMAREFIAADKALRNFQRGMFDATREAARGGGAMLQWTEMNTATLQQYMNTVAKARSTWRRSEEEIVGMFKTIGRSGIAAAANIQVSAADIDNYLEEMGTGAANVSRTWVESQIRMARASEELGKAVELGFKLEFLGLSSQQIQSLYHSMAVNLRMDMTSIEEALYKVFVTSDMTSFAWQEHVRYVGQALARYSKLGVTINDVSAYLLTMVERVRTAEGAFDRVGMVYETVMDRMGIRQQLGPEQQMRLFQMISPEQIGDIIGAPGTPARDQFEENIRAGVMQLDPSRRFTSEDITSRRLDPTQYLVVWQSMNEGMMNLVRLQAMQNIMGQQGAMGAELMPIWAAQMPEFATFWRSYQSGLLLDPENLREEFIAWRDSQTTMEGLVSDAEARLPEEQRGAAQFWGRVETQMTKVYDLLEDWKATAGRWQDELMLWFRSPEFRRGLGRAREERRRGVERMEEEAAIQFMQGEIPLGTDPAQVLGGIKSWPLRQFVKKRFDDVRTPQARAAAWATMAQDFASVMDAFVDITPEGQRVFQPLRFAEAGVEKGFLGLDLPDFLTLFKVLRRDQVPGADQLPALPGELIEALIGAGQDVRQRELERLRIEAMSGDFSTITAPRGSWYQKLLQELSLPTQVPIGPEVDVEGEPTSMGAPLAPTGGLGLLRRRSSIGEMKEEALALGGGTRPSEQPALQVTAHLHMGPGQTITFEDVVTQVTSRNAVTRNIAGEAPIV